MVAADGNHRGVRHSALLKNNQVARAGANVGEADSKLTLVGSQHGVGAGERFEYSVVHVHARFIHGGDHVLGRVRRCSHDVHTHFEARGHHAGGVLHTRLIVENELLRQQVQDFAISGQRHGACFVHRLADFVAANLARAAVKGDAAMAVHAADVRSGDADQSVLHRNSGYIFGSFYRFLNAADRFVELGDDALAQAAGLGDAVATVAQSVLADLGDQHTGLGAADVNRGNEIGRMSRHGYR